MRCPLSVGFVAAALATWIPCFADFAAGAGPTVGGAVPPLKVQAMTSDGQYEEADAAKSAADKPVVYLLVQHSKWDRPIARFLKVLDDKIRDTSATATAYDVFLSTDGEHVKEYLPRANQSLKFQNSTLASYTDDGNGPADWNVNGDDSLTVVVANKGKIAATFSYVSTNETDVPAVLEALSKALESK